MWNPFKSREYQVVLEFQDDGPKNFERVIALETKPSARVDAVDRPSFRKT
jgi:hypothetical protein